MADGAQGIDPSVSTFRAIVRAEAGEQFVVFPASFRIDADEVIVRQEGDALILEPAPPRDVPHTDAEWAAHWSDIDLLRGDDRLAHPERETGDGD